MDNLTEQEVRAFAGAKSAYYLRQWRFALDSIEGNATGFNWAALLFSGLWLPYRKMYRLTVIFFGVMLLEALFEAIVYVGILGQPEAPGTLGRFVGFVASIVCGLFGNTWYLAHAQKAVSEVRRQGLAEDAYFKTLAKRGGTNAAASLGFLLAFLVATLILGVLWELLLKRP